MAGRKVALHTAVGLYVLCNPLGADSVVKGNTIGTNGGMCPFVALARATWESDDRCVWMCSFHAINDFAHGCEGIFVEIIPFE